jgi:hypothetical protein
VPESRASLVGWVRNPRFEIRVFGCGAVEQGVEGGGWMVEGGGRRAERSRGSTLGGSMLGGSMLGGSMLGVEGPGLRAELLRAGRFNAGSRGSRIEGRAFEGWEHGAST